jgi:hypothetical protein
VRTLHQKHRLAQLNREIEKHKLKILGVSKVRWDGIGQIVTTNGKVFIYSGMPDYKDAHIRGVGILLSKRIRGALLDWNPVLERIITSGVKTKFRKMSVVHCYAPTDDAKIEEKE